MEKNFTSVLNKKADKVAATETPRQSTLDFIKQFARIYSYNQKMPLNLGGFIAN